MAKPHWVYSGLAVIDVPSGRKEIGWEKTKVFMTKLSDKEISRYYKLVSPLDKAGGFDIEGKGALFIPRIEGCYFNVVGLPLAKLACKKLDSAIRQCLRVKCAMFWYGVASCHFLPLSMPM